MRCPRCEGLMVMDAYLNLEGDYGQVWIDAWRCVNCGEIVDRQMMDNRRRQARLHKPVKAHKDKRAA